jgi:hypothetical protein
LKLTAESVQRRVLDVVALNWREQAILLGECKRGVDAMGCSVKPVIKQVARITAEKAA